MTPQKARLIRPGLTDLSVNGPIGIRQFFDADGYRTGIRQNWREATFTFGYHVTKQLLLEAEKTRADLSNQSAFFTKNQQNTSRNQNSFAINGLYKL